MEKWVPIERLFDDKKRWNNPSMLFIDYVPVYAEHIVPAEESGTNVNQKATTEPNIGWHPHMMKDGHVVLVSHDATHFRLALSHYEGGKRCEKILANCAEVYSNPGMGTIGRSITIKIFSELQEYLKYTSRSIYWLASGSDTDSEEKPDESHVCRSKLHDGFGVNIWDYNLKSINCGALRPIIEFTSNAIIKIEDAEFDGSTPEKAFKIRA